MPSWDEDSALLRRNLAQILEEIVESSNTRVSPTLKASRRWHSLTMRGLAVPNPHWIGKFRGEPGQENLQVKVGANYGVPASKVAADLKHFASKLQKMVAELDVLLPIGQEPDADELAAILDLCAWVHSEWVRIHPFANGNGRIARLWANSLALRYGLPPFICLRPRPNAGYASASKRAMQGEWKPTADVFGRLLDDFLA